MNPCSLHPFEHTEGGTPELWQVFTAFISAFPIASQGFVEQHLYIWTGVWGEVERLMLMDVVLLFAVDCESESPDAVYLPAELKVLNGPEYFRLQRTDRYMPGNASLSSRSETFLFLHRRLSGKPTIQAGYPPFTAQQVNSHMQLCKGTPFPFLIPAVRCFSRAQDFLSSPGNTS